MAALLAAMFSWSTDTALASSMNGVLEKARSEGRLTRAESDAIEARLEQARNSGLPTAPMTAKVEEGLAKRMSGRVILHALDAMSGDYAFARDVLSNDGSEPSGEDIVKAGDSLRLGLSRRELKELANEKSPAPMMATAARTWAYLNAIGFPAGMSSGILRQGLASGNLTSAWTQLFRVVQRARGAGVTDAALAEAASRILRDGGGPSELLLDLGFTARDTRQAPGIPAN